MCIRDRVSIAPADGKGTISNLLVGNPAGFKTAHAIKAVCLLYTSKSNSSWRWRKAISRAYCATRC